MDEVMILEGVNPLYEEDCPMCDKDDIEYWDMEPGKRYCVEVQQGSDGSCRCAKYDDGIRPPHSPTFKEMCDTDLAGVHGSFSAEAPRKGGKKMAGRKKGWFGAGIVEAIGIRPDLLKQILIAGAVAGGGAWLMTVLNNYVANSLKLRGQMRNVTLVALSALTAGLVYKFTKKKDIALAWGIGPVAIIMLSMTGKLADVMTGQLAIKPPGGVAGMGLVTGSRSALPYQPLAQPPTDVFPTVGNLFAESTVM